MLNYKTNILLNHSLQEYEYELIEFSLVVFLFRIYYYLSIYVKEITLIWLFEIRIFVRNYSYYVAPTNRICLKVLNVK